MKVVFIVMSFVFLGSLALLATSRNVRRAVLSGGVAGIVLGLWFLAPMSLRAHRLYPEGALQWLVVTAVLVALFLVLGLLLSLLTSWPLALAEWLPGRNFRNPQAAALTWAIAVLPFSYLALAVVLEWSFLSRISLPEGGVSAIAKLAIELALGVVLCLVLYRRLAAQFTLPRWVGGVLILAGMAALARLIIEVQASTPTRTTNPATLRPRTDVAARRPLLVIGLDGGNWKTLRPLINEHRLPTFERLTTTGVHGQIEALWRPFWSTPAWGSIVTGHHQDDLGVYENLGATAPFLPSFELPLTLNVPMNPLLLFDLSLLRGGLIDAAPADRRRLRRPPVWERLTHIGVKTAVVFFPFTYPAIGQAEYVVSNRSIVDIWDMMGVRPGQREELVSTRRGDLDLLASLEAPLHRLDALTTLLPDIERSTSTNDVVVEPAEVLRTAFDVGQRMFNVTEQIVSTNPDLNLVLLYVGDFDSVGHAFWPYRFPDDYPDERPSPEDIRRFGPVIDRYLEHLDRQIDRLIRSFPTPPNVIVVSDHGMEASDMVSLWKAWHSQFGVFMAAGPDIAPSAQATDVSYFDIVPTMLDLLGFQPAEDLRGRTVIRRP